MFHPQVPQLSSCTSHYARILPHSRPNRKAASANKSRCDASKTEDVPSETRKSSGVVTSGNAKQRPSMRVHVFACPSLKQHGHQTSGPAGSLLITSVTLGSMVFAMQKCRIVSSDIPTVSRNAGWLTSPREIWAKCEARGSHLPDLL